MNFYEEFRIPPGGPVRLAERDPKDTGQDQDKAAALEKTEALKQKMDLLQFRLYAEQKHSLLICLQALDAGGKDGVIRHVIGAMNPQGCRVVSFKQPTSEELTHDFLWRVERQTPKKGEVVVFNRSHYEDVIVVRVHNLVPQSLWSQRYDQINDFERRLIANDTHILKFYLHISKEEQLKRFKARLENPERQWKISEADYTEREFWPDYQGAYEEALSRCSTEAAPWFVIPADHKWFRDLAVSQIILETLERLGIQTPKPSVDIAAIKRKYHEAKAAPQ